MKQLYEVGEVVILQSIEKPELNGEYTVESIYNPREIYTCRLTGRDFFCPDCATPCYQLEGVFPSLHVDAVGKSCEMLWIQGALRKKQEPSQLSFNSLMDNLKLPQSA